MPVDTRKTSNDEGRIRDVIRDEIRNVLQAEMALIRNEFNAKLIEFKNEIKNDIKNLIKSAVEGEMYQIDEKLKKYDFDLAKIKGHVVSIEQDKLYEKRKELSKNFVISGLDEPENETADSLKEKVDDLLATLDSNIDTVSCSRVGKFSRSKSRMIKVITKDVKDRNMILSHAKNLRDSSLFRNVYINPDRCRIDRLEHNRLRSVVSVLRDTYPNKKVVFYKGKVLVDGEVHDYEKPLVHIFPEL